MSFSAHLLGIAFALVAAVLGGVGDFIGGQASRRHGPFPILILSSISGLMVMSLCALGWREALPSLPTVGWAMGAGVVGVIGMAALYRGLSLGYVASLAPTSGVIAAMVPILFAILTDGWPSLARLGGFAVALTGIWLVSQPGAAPRVGVTPYRMQLAVIAGGSFGVFFVLLGQTEPGRVFTPLVVARCASLATLWLLTRANRTPLPRLTSNPDAWVIGIIDGFGTAFYVLAKQYTRLELAAVLVSLYPAVTMLLAGILLREVISPKQWLGAAFCLAAIGLITMNPH